MINNIRFANKTKYSASSVPSTNITILHAGSSLKAFNVHTSLLISRSPMFRDLFIEKPQLMKTGKKRIEELTFREIDEFAFALFIRYKYLGEISKVKAYFS